ncbi:xanthine dehydrogenase family protein molybdopterin-binding subunit [Chloroflexota bacterium]
MNKKFSIIGKRLPLKDAREKVTGSLQYAVDLNVVNTLHAKILRSPHAHANIVKIDTHKAESLPGVEAVITHKDVPTEEWREVGGNYRGRVLDKRVRFFGDEVAAVAARNKRIAEEALRLIQVEYKELPHVFDVEEAMKPDAPQVLEDGNVRTPVVFNWGDVDKGFKESDLVVELKTTMGTQQHGLLGRNACIASWEGDQLTLVTATQTPFACRDELSRFLKLHQNKVRVIALPTGPSFGAWYLNNFHLITVFLAKKAMKPVRLELTQEECFATVVRRERPVSWGKLGVRKDGSFVSMHIKHYYDNGAYCVKPDPHQSISEQWGGRTPHGRFEMHGVSTNLLTGAAMRGVGTLTMNFFMEQLIDVAAEKLNIDPVEIRLKNHTRAGERIRPMEPYYKALGLPLQKETLSSCGLEECIKKGADLIGWQKKWKGWGKPVEVRGPKRRGLGVAVNAYFSGVRAYGAPSVIVKVNRDGSVNLLTGIGRMGQGNDTTQAQIAAEELGVPFENIIGTHGDTATCPWSVPTVASSSAHVVGLATQAAAADAKRQLCELASGTLGAQPEDLDIKNGIIYVKAHPEKSMSVNEVVSQDMFALTTRAGIQSELAEMLSRINPDHLPAPSIVGRGSKNVPPSPTALCFLAHFVELEVDIETGEIEILKYVSVQDSGTIINPDILENQVAGGIRQGSGIGLVENLIFDTKTGAVLNPNFLDYKILTSLDLPDPKILFADTYDPVGAFGVKGGGEASVNCPAPAISQAVNNATGIRLNYAPITPDLILSAWQSKINERKEV